MVVYTACGKQHEREPLQSSSRLKSNSLNASLNFSASLTSSSCPCAQSFQSIRSSNPNSFAITWRPNCISKRNEEVRGRKRHFSLDSSPNQIHTRKKSSPSLTDCRSPNLGYFRFSASTRKAASTSPLCAIWAETGRNCQCVCTPPLRLTSHVTAPKGCSPSADLIRSMSCNEHLYLCISASVFSRASGSSIEARVGECVRG